MPAFARRSVTVASSYKAQLERARRERDAPPPVLRPEATVAFDARIRKSGPGAAPEASAEVAARPAGGDGGDGAVATALELLAARAARRGALAEAEARRLDASISEVIAQLRGRGADG